LKRAATAKRQQLLSNYAAREAIKAQREIDKGLRFLSRFLVEKTRKNILPEYRDQIDGLLARFDLRRSVSNREIGERKDLRQWLQDQEAQGLEPPIDAKLLNEAWRTSYKEMSVEQFRGLVDAVKVINHIALEQKKLLTAKDQAEFEVIKNTLVASMIANASGKAHSLRSRNTWGAKVAQLWKGFLASHRKMASIAYEMDGFQDGGPMWEYFVRSMNEAGKNEAVMRENATKDLLRVMAPWIGGERMGGKGQWFESVGRSLNREERLAIALNIGNDGNLQRLLDGGIAADADSQDMTPLKIEQLQPVLDTLTKEDWDTVQAIWDYFETFRPQIAAKERRVNGIEPNWVEPTPVQTKFGAYRGGYYPIKYDPQASKRAQEHADAEAARQQLRGAYTSSTTRRSFTKERVDSVKGRPLLLKGFSSIYQGVNEIVHDLAWHEWLIDANRILRNADIDHAMRRNYGPEKVRQLTDGVSSIAAGDVGAQNAFEQAINHIRTGTTVAGLGWNLMTAMTQPIGLTQSMARIGPGWVAKGLVEWVKSPRQLVSDIYAKSDFMRLRGKTMNREINEVQNRITGGKGKVKSAIDASFFMLIERGQLIADIPTWQGAYEKAIAGGEPEARAIDLADQAVIDAQGSGQMKDLAGIQRGGPLHKLFTNFYSFFNVAYNLGVERTKAAARNPTPSAIGRLAVDYALLYVAPAVIMALIKHAMFGKDDDPNDLQKRLASEELSYLLGLMVGLREAGGAVMGATGYQGPAGTRFFSELGRLSTQAQHAVRSGDASANLLKDINNVAGILLHYPAAQLNRTVGGAAAMLEGRTHNPMSLLLGPPPKQ
jgi:hypothetical protein